MTGGGIVHPEMEEDRTGRNVDGLMELQANLTGLTVLVRCDAKGVFSAGGGKEFAIGVPNTSGDDEVAAAVSVRLQVKIDGAGPDCVVNVVAGKWAFERRLLLWVGDGWDGTGVRLRIGGNDAGFKDDLRSSGNAVAHGLREDKALAARAPVFAGGTLVGIVGPPIEELGAL